MNYEEVGAIEAIVSSITTLKDGSIKLSLELNPDNVQVINKLMTKYLNNERLFTIGIMQCIEYRGENDV
jgi:hypothetical protein